MPTSTPPHVLRVSAGPATVLVTSDAPAVTDWITQYFGCWWTVRPITSADDTSGSVLHCHVDPDRFAVTQDSLNTRAHRIIEFAHTPLHVADNTDNTDPVAHLPQRQPATHRLIQGKHPVPGVRKFLDHHQHKHRRTGGTRDVRCTHPVDNTPDVNKPQ